MGIAAIYPGPNRSRRHHDHQIYPYLVRGITASEPNHIWGIDITYIRMRQGGMYLVAMRDWYARDVVSWARDDTRELPFVRETVATARAVATPRIGYSD
jgi:putative transposase